LTSSIFRRLARLLLNIEKSQNETWWTIPALGLLATINLFTVFIPIDLLLIILVWFHLRRWLVVAFVTALGSTLGALVLFAAISRFGVNGLEKYLGTSGSSTWSTVETFSVAYGAWAVFLATLLPMALMPVVAFAALTHAPFKFVIITFWIGRTIKCVALAAIAAFAPKKLKGLEAIQREIKQNLKS
jgi:membrane protein YqaA with SNARE-associated domain